MRKIPIIPSNKLRIERITGYFIREVTKYGNGAKVDCPKEYLGRVAYVVLTSLNTSQEKDNSDSG